MALECIFNGQRNCGRLSPWIIQCVAVEPSVLASGERATCNEFDLFVHGYVFGKRSQGPGWQWVNIVTFLPADGLFGTM